MLVTLASSVPVADPVDERSDGADAADEGSDDLDEEDESRLDEKRVVPPRRLRGGDMRAPAAESGRCRRMDGDIGPNVE